jgi:hypothetical protein
VAAYSVSGVSATLVASTAVSVFELKTPAAGYAKITKWWVDFSSVTSTDKPILVQVGRFSAAVTTNTSVTPALVDYGGNGLASQCTAGINATTEGAGTFNTNGEQHEWAPNSSTAFWEPDNSAWQVPPSSFFRIRITPGSAITSATATFGCTWTEGY